MGKLILCSSPLAANPYHFRVTGTNVYSMEEVCYYISENIYIMQEEVFDREFAQWIRGELGMDKTADKLDRLIQDHKNLKDIVVTLCCSCDYFDEPQINKLIRVMDETENMPLRKRKKIKADNFLRGENYEKALDEYEQIISSDDMLNADEKEYGEMYHNMGVALAMLGSYKQASEYFRQAYERNKSEESKSSYLFALKFCEQEDGYQAVIDKLGIDDTEREAFDDEFTKILIEARKSKYVKRIEKIHLLAEDGKFEEYFEHAGMCLKMWKEEYRSQIRVHNA